VSGRFAFERHREPLERAWSDYLGVSVGLDVYIVNWVLVSTRTWIFFMDHHLLSPLT